MLKLLLILFFEFFKIGLFTIGGGYAMIPMIKELVLSRSWMSEEMFVEFLGVCESTPGPIALNMATFIGSKMAGILGSIIATLGIVLPSFIIIIIIAAVLTKLTKNKHFKNVMWGIRPVVTGLIVFSGLLLLIKAVFSNLTFSATVPSFDFASFAILLLLLFFHIIVKYVIKKKISNLWYILVSAVLGILICMWI